MGISKVLTTRLILECHPHECRNPMGRPVGGRQAGGPSPEGSPSESSKTQGVPIDYKGIEKGRQSSHLAYALWDVIIADGVDKSDHIIVNRLYTGWKYKA